MRWNHQSFLNVKDALVVLLIPVLFTMLFGYVYSNVFVEEIPIAVFDMDHSTNSKLVTDSFDDSSGMKVAAVAETEGQLENLILAGTVKGGVVIPPNFGKDVLAKQSPGLLVLIDGTNIVIGNNLYAYASTVVTTLNVGIQASILEAGDVVPYTATQYLSTLSFTDRMLYDPQMGYFCYVFAGVLGILIQQTYMSGLIPKLMEEKRRLSAVGCCGASSQVLERGLERRGMQRGSAQASERGMAQASKRGMERASKRGMQRGSAWETVGGTVSPLFGQIVRTAMMSIISFLCCLMLANKVYDYPLLGGVAETLALMVCFLFCMTAMAVLITAFFDDTAHCVQFSMFLSIPTFLTSGYVWPEFMMAPGFAPVIKAIWPLYYLCNPLRDVCMKGAGFSNIGHYLVGALIFAAVWLPVSILVYRRKVMTLKRTEARKNGEMRKQAETRKDESVEIGPFRKETII